MADAEHDPKGAEQGRKTRKVSPRKQLGAWSVTARRRTVRDLLKEAEKDCVPHLVTLKHERMRASAFGFFRGAAPVMAYDLSLAPHTGLLTQLCGDAHVQNLGAYASPDGSLTFDINDFDETMPGPFEWDLKRLATSLMLAGSSAHVAPKACLQAVQVFLGSYTELIFRLAAMPVLDAARLKVRHLATVAPIAQIFDAAEHATPKMSQAKLLEQAKQELRFKSASPLLRRVTGQEAKAVLAALPLYVQTLEPERAHLFGQFTALDVAFKVVGTGSVGLRDYCVYLQGNGADDPLFLQIKQEVASRYAPYLPPPAGPALHNGRRVVEGQRAMQFLSDPLLGWTTIDGRDYLVRQLNDHKASLNASDLNDDKLAQYARVCGELFARGHARSGYAGVLAGYMGQGPRFRNAIARFARIYAQQSTLDWKAFCGKH